jgi:D-sedoheptulose 7-phosphate isomerase
VQWSAVMDTAIAAAELGVFPFATTATNAKIRCMEPVLPKLVEEACRTLQALASQEDTFQKIAAAAVVTLKSGGKILTCGNGGSAADAMHLAEELVGHFRNHRPSLPAVSLVADGTLLTCIGNDYGFDQVFSRQVEGLANANDLLVCFSSSGNSPNILKALAAAKAKSVKSVALLGKGGGQARGKADFEIIIANSDSGRVQEAHTLILHALLEVIEREIAS